MSESKRTLIHQAGNILASSRIGDGKPGQSIMAMLYEQTKIWSYRRVHRATYKASEIPGDFEPAPNEFCFRQLRDGNTSIYLIIPPEHLTEYNVLLRVLIGSAMLHCKKSYKSLEPEVDPAAELKSESESDSQAKSQLESHPRNEDTLPVLFIMDEFAQLGYMECIEAAMGYIAGYGVRMWFFLQDISQLKLHYPESWSMFMANTDYKCFFGINDYNTAELVSNMIGNTTVDNFSHTIGISSGSSYSCFSGNSSNKGNNSSQTFTKTSRQLLTPDEVMRIPRDKQIIFIRGEKPIYCDRPAYYNHSDICEQSKIYLVRS